MKKPITLIIMDGFGINPSDMGNAIRAARTPNLDRIFASNPTTAIGASGMDVGLPDGQMGNSEVGHTNIGAGRVVYQELTRITKSIRDGDFFENPALVGAVENAKKNGTALHLIGLMSDGGVHSHNTHLWGLLELAQRRGLDRVFIHCLMDGRDVPPTSGRDFVAECVEKTREITGTVATVMGRYWGMDREKKWDRVERAYAALVYGEGVKNPDPVAAIEASYAEGVTDEFIKPIVCTDTVIKKDDSVIFFNFRPDRARELTRAFVDDAFDGFPRRYGRFPLYYVCMTQYDATMPNVEIAYKPQELHTPFGEVVANAGMKQLRIAEYTKYAHVTFFFNGGCETVYPGEDRVLIDSPNVVTYDLQPEMSAYKVTDEVCAHIDAGTYDAIILNFANCDMVGHTGVFDAAVKAVEAVDACVGRVVEHTIAQGGLALITADHGNAEKMLEDDGVSPFTAHTTNPVPFCIVGAGALTLRDGGRLADITPTMLDLMGIAKPSVMDGESLIVR
ncbi:MAG: 2,3-bisphosphoglycerate-independent phosphoglycerate mutase [Clostridiales bacterium]|jgi:2,3-bisphosphoglycerate-independent phosphoglycerate mutase|nr:2,3-bisphosphoglycerate-independent phosphoglycerate mutase [Clostridiales bacterium]